MELSICFLCLKRFKRENDENSDFRKFNLFCKFAKDYLGLKEFKGFKFKGFRENIEKNQEEENKNAFCEKCEIVVESVCQLYLEQLGIQLRLSWKLAEMQKLLENSKDLVSEELETVLITSLGNDFRAVKELRNLLEMKCMEKGKENVEVAPKSFVEASFGQLEYWVAIKREEEDDDGYEEADELEIGLPTITSDIEVKLEDEAETDQESIDVKEEFTANFEDEETRFDCNNNNEYYCASVEKDSQGDCSDWDIKEQDRNVHLEEEGYSVKVVEVEETIDKGNSTVRKVYFEL
ncbi:unnamed protein product [Orchesella dallaii]|uniref:Uncharacterized protein n=1 Tax=Orchesella dallaii TaxID=48710 RepID=A0ABP1RCY7_9HEXA